MTAAHVLVFGLQFIAIVFLLWDNMTLGRTLRRVFRDKMIAEDECRKTRKRLAALQSTTAYECSPSSK